MSKAITVEQVVAEIDYTVEVRRGRHEIPIRKTRVVRASTREKLGPAVERALAKLSDFGAFNVLVRWPAPAAEAAS